MNAAGFDLTLADSQVATADANGDGTQNDLSITASLAITQSVTVNAAALTGANRVVVVGTNLGGGDTITGGAGADTIEWRRQRHRQRRRRSRRHRWRHRDGYDHRRCGCG